MKKLAIVLSLITLGHLGALAQGTIQFNNSSTFPILIAPDYAPNTGTPIGTNTTSEYWGGGPGQVSIQMWVALASAPSQFFLAGTTTNSASTLASFQGTFHGGNPYTIPSSLDGGAFVQGTTIDYYFDAFTTTGFGAYGQSATGTGYVLGGGAVLPGVTFGTGAGEISGFTMIVPTPEPSTIALGGLGALAALLYRRRTSASIK